MICKKPFRKDGSEYGCGQCLPCRINHRRLWTHRLLLEQSSHEWSSFWTLTYDEQNYPANGSLVPRHTTLFLKRLRENLGDSRHLRYYLIGEYGDQTHRAHYHAALYGVHHTENALIEKSWQLGFTHSGELNKDTASYITGYIAKKLTKHDDPRLNGRYPEFARMSRNPGIGALAIPAIATALSSKHGSREIAQQGDVPLHLRHGRTSLPLGRYLRQQLRAELGFDHLGGQKKPEILRALEVLALCHAAGSTSAYLTSKAETEKVKILQIETRAKIWSKKGKL